jgi:hypothetical protein
MVVRWLVFGVLSLALMSAFIQEPPVSGLCCFFNNSMDPVCSVGLTEDQCVRFFSGVFLGGQANCFDSESNCSDLGEGGACCFGDDSCLLAYPDGCLSAGGIFQGLGTECVAMDVCDANDPSGECFDLNDDLHVGVDDLVLILLHWGPCQAMDP